MFYCYILKSLRTNKYYIGSCKDLEGRIKLHNLSRVKSTKNGKPWKLFYKEEFHTLKEARKRELQIKKWKSREAIERIVKHKI